MDGYGWFVYILTSQQTTWQQLWGTCADSERCPPRRCAWEKGMVMAWSKTRDRKGAALLRRCSRESWKSMKSFRHNPSSFRYDSKISLFVGITGPWPTKFEKAYLGRSFNINYNDQYDIMIWYSITFATYFGSPCPNRGLHKTTSMGGSEFDFRFSRLSSNGKRQSKAGVDMEWVYLNDVPTESLGKTNCSPKMCFFFGLHLGEFLISLKGIHTWWPGMKTCRC